MQPSVSFTYSLKDSSEEVDLILKGVNLCLQLNFVHVGAIYILKEETGYAFVGGLRHINNSCVACCVEDTHE